MEPQENKQLALQKAISSHEQAQAALADLMAGGEEGRYATLLQRVEQNLADLHREASSTEPEDVV